MLDRAHIAQFAKLAVTAMLNPKAALQQGAFDAIDRIVASLPADQESLHERMLDQLTEDLTEALAGAAEDIVQNAFVIARDVLARHGLGIEALVERGLDEGQVARDTLAAAADRLEDEGRAGELCGQVIIPAVYRALLRDPAALRDIELAFMRVVLERLDPDGSRNRDGPPKPNLPVPFNAPELPRHFRSGRRIWRRCVTRCSAVAVRRGS